MKFYSSFNAIYIKIGPYASEEVVLNLLNTKCISAMLYGTEACPVMSRHKHSLVTRVFMKILCTGSKQIVEESQKYFGFLPVSHRIDIRTARFLGRYRTSENSLCSVFYDQARKHMNELSVKFDITKVSSWHILHNAIHTSFFDVNN